MRGTPGAREPEARVHRLHLGSFLVYDGSITYPMALRPRTGVAFALLFALAMGLHFVPTDRALEEHHPRRFRRSGRYALAAALLAGWALPVVLAPTDVLVVSLLTALPAGSIPSTSSRRRSPPSGIRASSGY